MDDLGWDGEHFFRIVKAKARTVLEGYDYDLGRFTKESDWEGDAFDEAVAKWRPILSPGVANGEAWRVLLLRGVDVERVEYLSRPSGF